MKIVILILAMMAGVVACDRTVEEKHSEIVKEDGTTVTHDKEVTVDDEGNKSLTETHTVDESNDR